MDKNFNRHVTKDALQIANEHIERCSKSLVRGKCKLKPEWHTTLYPLTIKIKKTDHIKAWQEDEAIRILLQCQWEFEMAQSLWITTKQLSKSSF